MKFATLLIIFLIIVILDKGITAASIIQVNKHFPEATKEDYFKVEKNPVAHWFFQKTGLFWGSIIYGILSIVTLFIALFLIALAITSFGVSQETADRVGLWIIFIFYGFVISNNAYFLLKYSAIIS
jgi:hypothetical protein